MAAGNTADLGKTEGAIIKKGGRKTRMEMEGRVYTLSAWSKAPVFPRQA